MELIFLLNAFLIVLPLGLIMATGYFLRRRKVITENGIFEMNNLLYWVAMPSILFRSTLKVDPSHFSNTNFMLSVYGVFIILPVIAWGLASLKKGISREKFAVSILVSIRGNNVFMGLPAVTIALGEPGLESYGIYLALTLVVYQIISISMGQLALSGEFSMKSILSTLKRLVRNPLFISCTAGLLMSLAGFGKLPGWLDQTLIIFGNIGSGVALVALGASLKLQHLFSSFKHLWNELLVRLILSPLLMWIFFQIWPVDDMLMKTSIIVGAMPAAVNNFVLAKGMGMDSEYAGEVVMTTTVFSILTLTFWLTLIG